MNHQLDKIEDFTFTKLTRLLLEVPTRHQSCGDFIIVFSQSLQSPVNKGTGRL